MSDAPGDAKAEARSPPRPPLIGIPANVRIFDTWANKLEMYNAGVHQMRRGGIHGTGRVGAESVVMNGTEYEDRDHGDTFTFIGSGPKDRDQTWEGAAGKFNNSLRTSAQNGNPVRVIRGSELPSRYAPSKGFRFDGLYTVANPRLVHPEGGGAYKVCMFDFTRCPGQPPLPIRSPHDQVGIDTDVEIRGAMWGAEKRVEEDASSDISGPEFAQDFSGANTVVSPQVNPTVSAEGALSHVETHINHLSQSTPEDGEHRTNLILIIGRAIAKIVRGQGSLFADPRLVPGLVSEPSVSELPSVLPHLAALERAIFSPDDDPEFVDSEPEPMDIEPTGNVVSTADDMLVDESPSDIFGVTAPQGGSNEEELERRLWAYVSSRLPTDLSDVDAVKLKAWYESAVVAERSL